MHRVLNLPITFNSFVIFETYKGLKLSLRQIRHVVVSAQLPFDLARNHFVEIVNSAFSEIIYNLNMLMYCVHRHF